VRVTAILTSHNRCERTLLCLRSFYCQRFDTPIALESVLVDDCSTDGTEAEVRRVFPDTKVVRGSGHLYWACGMAVAERVASTKDPDYLLWLNDDVTLDPGAVATLLRAEEAVGRGQCIVAGAVRDPQTGTTTYSGVRRHRFHPLRMHRVEPGDQPKVIETFNGNVVLVSRRARRAIGPIDGAFSHAQADLDYGLRARRAGIACLLAPGTVGTCRPGNEAAPWRDVSLLKRQRLRLLLGRKGLPPRSAARFLRRHGGPLWMIFWIAPYARAIPAVLLTRRPRP
jgi:GT2 family glycosyltransferase